MPSRLLENSASLHQGVKRDTTMMGTQKGDSTGPGMKPTMPSVKDQKAMVGEGGVSRGTTEGATDEGPRQ